MRRGLTGVGKVVYGVVMLIGGVVDLGLLAWLFLSRQGVAFVLFFLFGTWLIPTVAHIAGLALAAPFLIAGYEGEAAEPSHASPEARRVPRWTLLPLAVVVLGALVAGDWWLRNVEMNRLIRRVEVAEDVMYSYIGAFDDTAGKYDRGSLDDEETLSRVASHANSRLERLLVAQAHLESMTVVPWHPSIGRARTRYLHHVDAWMGKLRGIADEPEVAWDEHPEVGATFTLACGSLRTAIPPSERFDLRQRIDEIC